MPSSDHNAIVHLACFRYIGRHLVKLAVANGMSVLDNFFRITSRTLVVALAGVAAPSCGGRSWRLRFQSEWARSPNRHGCRGDQHAVEKIASRDGLVQTKQLVRVRTISHCFFPLSRPHEWAAWPGTPVPYPVLFH